MNDLEIFSTFLSLDLSSITILLLPSITGCLVMIHTEFTPVYLLASKYGVHSCVDGHQDLGPFLYNTTVYPCILSYNPWQRVSMVGATVLDV